MARTQDNNNLLVHMSHTEAAALDYAQGGPTFDPETGLREYSAWSELIKKPEIEEIAQSFDQDAANDGKVDDAFHEMYQEAAQHVPPFTPAPGDDQEPFKELAAKGTEGPNDGD